MKYHEKLNLKSPIFKYSNNNTSRTPTKSPIKPPVNPSDLFQKVCCPNCKYAFKIIKQQVVKQNPLEMATPTIKRSKLRQKRQTETQTDNKLENNNSKSPTKSIKSRSRLSRTYEYSPPAKTQGTKLGQSNKLIEAQYPQSRNFRQSEYKFEPLSLSPNNTLSKSKDLLRTLDSKRFPVLSSETVETSSHLMQSRLNDRKSPKYDNLVLNMSVEGNQIPRLENYPYSPRKSSEKLSESNRKFLIDQQIGNHDKVNSMTIRNIPNSSDMQNPQFSRNKSTQYIYSSSDGIGLNVKKCRCQRSSELALLMRDMMIKNQQNEHVAKELKQFCKMVSEEVQVPSYYKMLASAE